MKFDSQISNSGFSPADVTFTNNSVLREGSETPTYTWSFGDGTTSNETNPVHKYEKPGNYKVTLVAVLEDDVDFLTKTVVIKDPDALNTDLYVMDAGDQRIYNILDGSSINVGVTSEGIDFDEVNQFIYFTDVTDGELTKIKLDGTEKEVVATGFTEPQGVLVDATNNNAYVADRGTNQIIRVNLTNGTTSVFFGIGNNPDFHNANWN